jgi:hypothetical protein
MPAVRFSLGTSVGLVFGGAVGLVVGLDDEFNVGAAVGLLVELNMGLSFGLIIGSYVRLVDGVAAAGRTVGLFANGFSDYCKRNLMTPISQSHHT